MVMVAFGADAQDAWYIFDSYVDDNDAMATATAPDSDGNYVFELDPSKGRSQNFYFVNTPNALSDYLTATYVGSAESGPCVNVESGMELDCVNINRDTAYADKGGFAIPNNGLLWIIKFNPTTMKASFTSQEMPEEPEEIPAAPDKLWVVDYTAQFGEAENDGNGVFTFYGVTFSDIQYPSYGFANNASPQNASVVISAVRENKATSDNNVTVEKDKVYTWHLSSQANINSEIGCFRIPDGVSYNVILDWNAQTVVFTDPTMKVPDKLYFVDYHLSFGEAANDGNGIFRFEDVVPSSAYPYYGFSPEQNPNDAEWVAGTVANEQATRETNVNVEPNVTYPWEFSQLEAINGEKGSYVLASGVKVDIAFDWNNKTVTFTQNEQEAPATLWIGNDSGMYGSATNDSGIYKFKRVNLSAADATYGFYEAEDLTQSEFVLTGSLHPTNSTLEMQTPAKWVYGAASQITSAEGGFSIAPGSYDITVDWNNHTVLIEEPSLGEAPATLWLTDYLNQFGEAQNNGMGVFKFEAVSTNSQYPFYAFCNNPNPKVADIVISAASSADATSENNVDVQLGIEYPWALTIWDKVDAMHGCFRIPDGTYDIFFDWNNKTVRFEKPRIAAPETLYATSTYLDDTMGACANNGSDVFEMTIDFSRSSGILVFTNSTDFTNNEGNTIYYGSEGAALKPEYGTTYNIALSSYAQVWGDETGFRLTEGRYKAVIDFNEGTVVFHDISRGDIWTIPSELNMYNDDMQQLAAGTAVEDGVFTFDNVNITENTRVVFTDNPTAEGKFFGANMTGERGPEVKNFRTYDLYIPTFRQVYVDGLSCFGLPAGTWNIRVDMNEKNVSFTDPTATYYPEEILVVNGGSVTDNRASGSYEYCWKIELAEDGSISFRDALTGRTYGSPEADVTITEGEEYDAAGLDADNLHVYNVPAGTWEAVLNLKTGKVAFYKYISIKPVDSTMKDGDKFYSYFGAGTQPNMTITFSGNPYTVEEAFLALGDYTPGMKESTDACTIENINIYRTGNTLFTDFSGKARVLPAAATTRKVTLVITSICSVHGLLIETDAIEGLPEGSLMYTFDFEDFQPVSIESRLSCGEGTAPDDIPGMDNVEEVTLWVKPYNLITFDGVVFTRPQEVTEPAETTMRGVAQLDDTIEAEWHADENATDEDGFTPITVKVPMMLRGSGVWNVALRNLAVDDNSGNEHKVAHAVRTDVHPADIFTADPEDGSNVDELLDITLTWNHPLVMSAAYLGAAEPDVEVVNEAGDRFAAKLIVLSTLGENQMLIHLDSPIKTKGKYNVIIPENTIILNNEPETNARELSLEYEVTGILEATVESMIADNPDAETFVYTTSGILLRHGRAADVLADLESGIYVINGIKIIVR